MAATTVDELKVLITAQSDQFNRELSKVQKQLGTLDKSTKGIANSVPKSFGRVSTAAVAMGSVISSALTSAFGAITSSVGDAVTRLDTLKNYPRVMASLGYSASDAQKSIEMLDQGVQGLPTSLDAIVQSTQGFATVSPNLASATRRALALNDALLASGASTDAVSRAQIQFNQMLATGKADMQSWNSIVMTMPGQMQQVSKSLLGASGSTQKLHDAIVNGTISTQQLADEIVKLDQNGLPGFGSFREQAEAATGGIGTSIQNMKTAIVRGLANIMDAIGQANIAAFFNGVARAINAVVPYIVAFVRIMVAAVSFVGGIIGKIFGGGGGGGTKQVENFNKAAEGAAASVGNIGAGVGDVGGGLDSAAGKAKKLQKQLASFDEMNVLTEKDSGDSGGGGAGGAGGGAGGIPMDFGGIDGQMNGVADKAKEIADKIQKALQTAFNNVKNFIEPIWNSEPVQRFVQTIAGIWDQIYPNLALGTSNVVALFSGMGQQFLDTWNVYAPQIGANIMGTFTAIAETMAPALVLASQIWADFTGILLDTWNTYGASIFNGIGEFLTNITGTFKKLWTDILEPIIKPFLEELQKTWSDSLKPMVEAIVQFIAKLIDGALQIYNKFISPIINWLIGALAPAFVGIGNTIGGVVNTVLRLVGDVASGIFRSLGGIIDFITGIFTGNWRRAWQGIQDIFGGIFSALGGIAKAPINALIDIINGFISGINQIKIPDWVPGVGGKNLNLPKIPKLARGGITTGSTLAEIGEAGREAVLPLENNTGWMDDLAAKLGGSGQPIHLTVKIGEDTIMEKVVDGLNDASFMRNANVLTV